MADFPNNPKIGAILQFSETSLYKPKVCLNYENDKPKKGCSTRPLSLSLSHPTNNSSPESGGRWQSKVRRNPAKLRENARVVHLWFRARFFEPRVVPPAKSKLSESTTSLDSQIFRTTTVYTQKEVKTLSEQ